MAEKCAMNTEDGNCPAAKRNKLEDNDDKKKNAVENKDGECPATKRIKLKNDDDKEKNAVENKDGECPATKRIKLKDDDDKEKNAVENKDGDCPAAKRIKLKDDDDKEKNTVENKDGLCERTNLSSFEVTRVLQNNCARKLICVEGTFKDRADPAIVLLEQKSFPNDMVFLKKGFFSEKTIYQKNCVNDVYGNYDCFPAEEYNSLRATVIHPATPNQIKKYLRQESLYMIDETYEFYQQVTLPYIESMSLSLEWITNILEHKAEEENIIYEDTNKETGFVLVTDLKWDKQLDTLKLLALPLKKIKSLRELDGSHLPLLKNIQKAGTEAISKKFNIPASQLRIYFHYQPSYYYLHIHFCYLMFEAPGIYVEKAHLLSTVIRNLELMPDYYTKAVLSYMVRKDSPLYERFKSHGVLPSDIKVCNAQDCK